MKIDVGDAMMRLGNNKKLYATLLGKFDGDAMLADLQAKLAEGDVAGAQAQAHAIKGLAANLSLADLCEQAGAAETVLKGGGAAGEVDAAGLSRVMHETAAAVRAWLSENA